MDQASQKLQKKQLAAAAVVLAPVAIKGAEIIVKIAIELASETLSNLKDWNEVCKPITLFAFPFFTPHGLTYLQVREAFTKKTTEEMWARNADYVKFPAVACYNKGYRLKDPAGIDGLLSAKLSLGQLNTE